MKQIVFIAILLIFNSNRLDAQDRKVCEKCNKAIIETVIEKYDKLTISQVEEFLCSFDKSCNLKKKYKNSAATYEELAFEMLIVELDLHLEECLLLIDSNKNIEFQYLISLLENAAGHDLPYLSIIDKLEKNKSLTANGQRILNTLKDSESRYRIK
jgi:hypothetical protein